MSIEATYSFDGVLREPRHGDFWVLVALPPDDAADIASLVPTRPGFGSVRVTATIGATEWTTSIYPDNAVGSYLLPVKKAVRDREGVDIGDTVRVHVAVLVD